MNLKENIEKLVALSKEGAPIRLAVKDNVIQTAIQFARANHFDGPTEPKSVNSWRVIDDVICVHFSEFWGFGGHSDGDIEFPAELVYDKEKLAEYIQLKKEEDEIAMVKEQERRKNDQLSQLNQLKKELGVS